MRQALRSKGHQSQVSLSKMLPAPTQGWYVGTNISDAPEGTAFALDNAFPQLDYVRLRRGSAPYATGMVLPVESLMTWSNGLTSRMFAASGGSVYDVSSSGVAPAPSLTGMSSAVYESLQFTGTGGTFLRICNGLDPSMVFTGSAWQSTPAITGMNGQPAQMWTYKNRIYMTERNTLDAWYLPLDSIGGAAVKFPLSSVFQLGGTLLCGATWAVDTSNGLAQSCVFISSEGEVAVYSGTYPGDTATLWTLIGLFKVSRPLGRRCLMRAGGDLGIMTEDGIVPMSKVVTLDQVALQNAAVTKPIAPAWRQAVVDRFGLSGWQIVIWPLESMGVITLPKTDVSDCTQFIANVRTGAWARYLGWDARCFVVFNNELYFGSSDGRVMQAETGGTDDGQSYTTTIFPSFSDFGMSVQKQVRLVRPFIQANYRALPKITVKVDYDPTPLGNLPNPTTTPYGALWDTAIWDQDVWPFDLLTQQDWIGVPGFGSILSPAMQIAVGGPTEPDVRLTAIQVLYEPGNVL